MKKVLIAGVLSLLSIQAFAQIDDVVNKPGQLEAISQGEGELYTGIGKSVFRFLIPKFQSIGFTTLTDEMKRDGVTERKFNAAFDIKGNFEGIKDGYGEDVVNMIPFTVQLSTDGKYRVTASLLEASDWVRKYIDKGDYIPLSKLRILTFVLDDGMEFRDIKTMGFKIFELEATAPVIKNSSSSYLAIVAGTDWGYSQETIQLEDGTIAKFRGAGQDDSDPKEGSARFGNNYSLRAGIEFSDKVARGVLKVRGVVEFSEQLSGMYISPEQLDYYYYDGRAYSNFGDSWNKTAHSRIYVKPEVSYKKAIGFKKKNSVELGVGANIRIVDKLRSRDESPDFNNVHFKNYSRTPYNATIRLNF